MASGFHRHVHMRVCKHTKSQIFKVFHGVSLDTQQSHLLAVVGCLYSNTVSKHLKKLAVVVSSLEKELCPVTPINPLGV